MNRFPKHYHETPGETPVFCCNCGGRLDEDETSAYYSTIETYFEPWCNDCKSEFLREDIEEERERWNQRNSKSPFRLLSTCVFIVCIACFVTPAMTQMHIGQWLLGGIGCLSLSLLLRIYRL